MIRTVKGSLSRTNLRLEKRDEYVIESCTLEGDAAKGMVRNNKEITRERKRKEEN